VHGLLGPEVIERASGQRFSARWSLMQSITGFLQPFQDGSDSRLEFNEVMRIGPAHDLLQLGIHGLALGLAAKQFCFQQFTQRHSSTLD
jgi:hypothetical protein